MTEQNRKPENKPKRASPFRSAERCLYDYKKNLARLEVLREDLRVFRSQTSVKVQDYDFNSIANAGGHSDPVAARLLRIERLEEEIAWLERRTVPITRLRADLESSDVLEGTHKADLAEILRLLYLGGNTASAVISELKFGRSVFFDKRRALVYMAIDYLGF